jgi:ribosomal protein S6 kinase alpha-5
MAPEVVQTCADGYDMAVDLWSLGIVTYELLTGKTPFARRTESESDEVIYRRIIMEHPHLPDDLSSDAAHFISKLLVKDSRKRLGGGKDGAEELKRHPFLEGMDWSYLAQKNFWTPFERRMRNDLDVSNFPDKFTQIIPADLPATPPPNCDDTFWGYSYVSSPVLKTCTDSICRRESWN